MLVGLFTRAAAFILSGMMAVAYWGFHAPMNIWPANNMGSAAILFSFIYLYLVSPGRRLEVSTLAGCEPQALDIPGRSSDFASDR